MSTTLNLILQQSLSSKLNMSTNDTKLSDLSPTQVASDKDSSAATAIAPVSVCSNNDNETITGDALIVNISLAQYDKMRMVNTPAKKPRNNTAFCQIEQNNLYVHFPHYMQFILPCWSFFQMQAKETNIIVVPDAKYRGRSTFQTGINDILLKLGIQIETSSTMGPYLGQGNNSSSVSIGYYDGFFMASPAHAKEFRRQFMAALGLVAGNNLGSIVESSAVPQLSDQTAPKIAILNREKSRRLMNVDAIAKAIQEELNMEDTVAVVDFANATFKDQVKFFSEHDIVISPHGAQVRHITQFSSILHCLAHIVSRWSSLRASYSCHKMAQYLSSSRLDTYWRGTLEVSLLQSG